MGCGCSAGKRDIKSGPATVLNTVSSNRRIIASANQNPPIPVSENLGTPNVLDQDRLRIERLRREAQRRSLGR
jgi:hypothetical protein